MANVLDDQGTLPPKGVVRSGQISNSSKILLRSSLSASVTKIESKLTVLARRHRFPQTFRHSRASNSEVNSPIRPEVTLLRDFIHVLVTSKAKR